MARGFLSGILVGSFVSALGLGTASLLSEQPAGNTPPVAPQTDAPAAGEVVEPDTAAPSVSGPGEGDGPSMGPVPDAAEPDAQSALPLADTQPPEVPAASGVEGALETPAEVESGAIALEEGAPVLPSPQAAAPDTPAAEADIVLSTDPAAPPAAVVVDEAPEPVVVEVIEDPETSPQVALQGADAAPFSDIETGVTVNRIGTETSEAAPAEAESEAEPQPALIAYGAAYENPDDLPVMSITLLDDGSLSTESAAAVLSGLPFPVTIALDPTGDDSAEKMALYRAEGYEVAVLASLPEGATPSDVEIVFQSVFADIPEAVAVLDIGEGGFQADRAATEQAMAILAQDGLGFVTISQGRTLAGRAAEEAEVPSAIVYRDLDGNGQDARTIRRFVDQAAFRARQSSGVVLIGRIRADTLTALINWGNDRRAGQVAQVPLSAVLLAQ